MRQVYIEDGEVKEFIPSQYYSREPIPHAALQHNMRVYVFANDVYGYVSWDLKHVFYSTPTVHKMVLDIRPDTVLYYGER